MMLIYIQYKADKMSDVGTVVSTFIHRQFNNGLLVLQANMRGWETLFFHASKPNDFLVV